MEEKEAKHSADGPDSLTRRLELLDPDEGNITHLSQAHTLLYFGCTVYISTAR